MNHLPLPLATVLALAAALGAPRATAQVTGVAGLNDYTINGSTPGSQSCTSLCFATPLNLTLDVNTVPGAFVMILWTDCPCRGCSIPWLANACTPSIPLGSAPGCTTTNQSIDMFPAPGCQVIYSGTAIANAAGLASITVSVPLLNPGVVPCAPFSPRFSTQAVVLDPCGVGGFPVGPGPFVLTQAYDVGF